MFLKYSGPYFGYFIQLNIFRILIRNMLYFRNSSIFVNNFCCLNFHESDQKIVFFFRKNVKKHSYKYVTDIRLKILFFICNIRQFGNLKLKFTIYLFSVIVVCAYYNVNVVSYEDYVWEFTFLSS